MNQYIFEKLQELEKENAAHAVVHEPSRRRAVMRPVFRMAGRTLRRFGEGLEAWGGYPPSDADAPQLRTDSAG